MSATLTLLEQDTHGTPAGYRAGCHGSACPAPVACRDVYRRYVGDYGFKRRVDAGESPGGIIAEEQAELAAVRERDRVAARAARRAEAVADRPNALRPDPRIGALMTTTDDARLALAQYEGTRSTLRAERENSRRLAAALRALLDEQAPQPVQGDAKLPGNSDDEREALASIICWTTRPGEGADIWNDLTTVESEQIADAILAAGWRREVSVSVPPETETRTETQTESGSDLEVRSDAPTPLPLDPEPWACWRENGVRHSVESEWTCLRPCFAPRGELGYDTRREVYPR